MRSVFPVSTAQVNGVDCTKISVVDQGDERLEIDFMLKHGKYTTIVISLAELLELVAAATGKAGGLDGGSKRVVE